MHRYLLTRDFTTNITSILVSLSEVKENEKYFSPGLLFYLCLGSRDDVNYGGIIAYFEDFVLLFFTITE